MGSDDATPRQDARWRQAGTGMAMHFRCAKCDQPRKQLGSATRRVRGVKQKVCEECKVKIDARKA